MAELVDYGISYGECIGYCTTVLRVDGLTIELIQTSEDPDDVSRRFMGTVDRDLAGRIASDVAKLDPGHLMAVYGEPDSGDEGAVTLRIRGLGGTTAHVYSRGAPPAQLTDVDDLLSPILTGWLDGEPVAGVSVTASP